MNNSRVQLLLMLMLSLGCSSGTTTTQHTLKGVTCESLLNDTGYQQQLVLPKETQIPGTLEECIVELDRILNPYHKKYLHCLSEEKLIPKVHHTLGKWLRTHWQLWEQGPLREDFEKQKIYHADAMSSIIILKYHRHLNQEPMEMEEIFEVYLKYWKANVID